MKALHLATILIAVAACESREPPQSRSADRPPPQIALSGTRPEHMRNCPSGIASARTSSQRVPGGVDVTITARDPAARRELAALAKRQSAMAGPVWLMPPHSGMHGGPGTIGYCPIIHADTLVTYDVIPDGVRIHVTARAPGDVTKLQEATEARVRTLAMPAG